MARCYLADRQRGGAKVQNEGPGHTLSDLSDARARVCVCCGVGVIRERNWQKKRRKNENKMQMAALENDDTGIRQKSEARWKTQKAAATVDSGGGGGGRGWWHQGKQRGSQESRCGGGGRGSFDRGGTYLRSVILVVIQVSSVIIFFFFFCRGEMTGSCLGVWVHVCAANSAADRGTFFNLQTPGCLSQQPSKHFANRAL